MRPSSYCLIPDLMRSEFHWKMRAKTMNCLELSLVYATKRQLRITTAIILQIDVREKSVGYIIMIKADRIME